MDAKNLYIYNSKGVCVCVCVCSVCPSPRDEYDLSVISAG